MCAKVKVLDRSKKGENLFGNIYDYFFILTSSLYIIGSITRIENALDELESRIINRESEIGENKKALEDAKVAVDLPFEQAEELESLQNELSEIDAELDLGKQETPIVLDEPDGEKMELEILDEEEDEAEIA